MRFGRWCFYIHAYPEGSTISRYETLKQVEKTTRETPKELQNVPTLGEGFDYALQAYKALSTHSWLELDAYIRLSGNALTAWEIEAVMTLAQHKDEVPTWPLK